MIDAPSTQGTVSTLVTRFYHYLAVAQDCHSVALAEELADIARQIADHLPAGADRDRWAGVARAYELY